jgi:hypothetical protein
MKRAIGVAAFAGALCLFTCAPARAQSAEAVYNPFAQSRVRASVVAGLSSSGDETYLILGGGAGYYLTDGLELGLDTDVWLIGDPTVWNVTPGLLYVFYMVPTVKPYLGTFYRHAFVFDSEDLDSIGGHAGLYFVTGRVYLGVGAVYEHWLGCDDDSFTDCDAVYPELVLAFSF